MVGQLQNRFVLLLRSFTRKFNHLLRTTRPDFIRDFAEQFDQLKKEVVESVTSLNKTPLDAKTWRQMGLKVNDGGLGLISSADVISPAYIAGIVAAFPSLPEALQDELRSDNGPPVVYPELVRAFKLEVQLIEERTYDRIPIASLFTNINYADKGGRLQESLQDKIYEKALHKFKQEVIPTMSKSRKAIYMSTCSQSASAWLTVVPHREELRMISEHFQAALCHRYHLDQPSISVNLRCTCKKGAIIDAKGVHIQQFCGLEGWRHDTHNVIAHVLANIMRGAGCIVRTEQRICPDNGRRSDCSTNQNPLSPEPLHIDVMVTGVHPEVGDKLSNAKALIQGRAAEAGYQFKMNDYGELPIQNNFHFLPFIVENHGLIHSHSLKLIEVLASKAELTWRLPSKIIFEYWLKLLSVTLHRAMANSIVSRARSITCGIASKGSTWKPIVPEEIRAYVHMDR